MNGVLIDWTISLGNLINVAIFVGGLVALFYGMKADIRVVKHDMGTLKQRQEALGSAFEQLGAILTKVAVQDTRINLIDKQVDELRHGQGFIEPPSHRRS